MRLLLTVIKMREKETKNTWRETDERERLMNKLSFSVDKLPLQEACCRPCFCLRVYTTGFLQLTFNSQVSIPDKGFWRGPTKQANANKKESSVPRSTICCWNYALPGITVLINQEWNAEIWGNRPIYLHQHSEPSTNDPLWRRAVFT